ncbi:MAG: AraC family transcriptional regulator [Planctomycetota bacterium]|nr:AraC family transcriptional regulator [Planctomycetota bacterium]
MTAGASEEGVAGASGATGGIDPWDAAPAAFFNAFRQQLPFDAAAIGIFHARKPDPDEYLAADGFNGATLGRWCSEGFDSEFFRQARRKGLAVARGDQTDDPDLTGYEQVLAAALSESAVESRSWWMVLSLRGREYTTLEQQVAGLLLRQCQVSFDEARDPVAGRLILGHDDRIIHANPWLRLEMLHHPQMFVDLLRLFHPVIDQRYPELKDLETRDMAIDLAGRPFWLVFHRANPTGLPDGRSWSLELHPLEKGELPTVGEVVDERISRSLAFIHENYSRSPSLAETAEAAHVSPFHFHRLFTQAVGVSPKQYVQRKQLQVARFLLRSTRLPVGDIASQAGFSSHGHFTSTFHRTVGKSPRDYRESR